MKTSGLNPAYTFETFAIGASARFARAVAVAVAEAPGTAYNPVFIHDDQGASTTHLLHAIGNYAQTLYPRLSIGYVSAEEFTSDFIEMSGEGNRDDFGRRYRDLDILLVDDVQFLANTEGVQEEFLHTVNTLHEAGKQVVVAGDRPPHRLVNLDDTIRVLLGSGMVADIQPPELETRLAILHRLARKERIDVPPEVLERIARQVSSKSELDGALICLSAFASVNR